MGTTTKARQDVIVCFSVGVIGFFFAPWYLITDGFWSLTWLIEGYPLDPEYAPAIVHIFAGKKFWLVPLLFFVLAPALLLRKSLSNCSRLYLVIGGGGLFYMALQGFAIGIFGWQWQFAELWFGPLEDRQFGLGYGGAMVALMMLYLLAQGFAMQGLAKGDRFVGQLVSSC